MYTLFLLAVMGAAAASTSSVALVAEIPGQGELGYIEVRGVAAGAFDPNDWQKHSLHMLPDLRAPLLEPRYAGPYRNIYAPSAVRLPEGWRLFYGAWDGVATPNDQIYSVTTPDFLDFASRDTVIAHGIFTHVCNVNAFRNPDGRFEMMCTVYPDKNGQNKPAYFSSADGVTWNGSKEPYPAAQTDIVTIDGYTSYTAADINGTNVLLREGNDLHLFFNNNHDPAHVFCATGQDGKRYKFDGAVLDSEHGVNDVKVFSSPHGSWYLMALHQNATTLWYSISTDFMHFTKEQFLLRNLDENDQYIVAVGWVCEKDRLLGVLYGAGPVKELNRNRIFARWLQKKVVFVAGDKTRFAPEKALGPDRQILRLRPKAPLDGQFEVYAEDGHTLLGVSKKTVLKPGTIYEFKGIERS